MTESKDANDNTTKNIYDDLGRLVASIDEMNETTSYSYDNLGRLISVTDPLSGQSSQIFDAEGNLISRTDPNGNESIFSYDKAGRLISETTAIGSINTYGYNSKSLITSLKNGRDQERTYSYDEIGRVTEFVDVDGKVSYKYDANGNVLEVTSEEGTTKREYDALNRVIKFVDTRGNVIGYQYTETGNLSKMTYPDGRAVIYVYDKTEQLTKVTDWAGRETTYSYDENGRQTQTQRSNGTTETTTYDKAGRIVSRVDKNALGVEINRFEYEYDNKGNVTVETGLNIAGVENLTNAIMKYTDGNKLISYNNQEVKYDADGNMIYGPLDGNMVDFSYDSRNRLVKSGTTTYKYDGENTRISITESGVTTNFITNPNTTYSQVLIKEKQGSKISYVYGNGLIGQEEGIRFKTYHYDLRGSTTHLTDETGTITDTFSYGPYGEVLSKTNSDVIFLYNGRDGVQTDKNNLYYMRARYYNPDIKRFINQDVLQGDISEGKSLNRYAYVHGNPISLVDPFGLSPESKGMTSMAVHFVLSIVGMIPGPLGIAADLINGLIYAIEGDYISALQSVLSAVIPILPCNIKLVAIGINAVMDFGVGVVQASEGNYLGAALSFASAGLSALNIIDGVKGTWKSCFTADTLVLYEYGYKEIKDVEVGDMVYASDIETGETVLKEVLEVSETETDTLYHVFTEDEEIKTTKTHPFYVEDKGWVSAEKLEIGDRLKTSSGQLIEIEKIEIEELDEVIKVYNFEVEGLHNYFVSKSSLLVHNNCTGDTGGSGSLSDTVSTDNKELMEHLVDGHGIGRKKNASIKGTHDLKKFYEVIDNEAVGLGLTRSDYIISIKNHPSIEGIYEIMYQIPVLELDRSNGGLLKAIYNNDGNLNTKQPKFPKTVFESGELNNILEWGKEAIKSFEDSGGIMQQGVNKGVAKNGLGFEWRFINGKIESIYPV